jgi:hypothetical protein
MLCGLIGMRIRRKSIRLRKPCLTTTTKAWAEQACFYRTSMRVLICLMHAGDDNSMHVTTKRMHLVKRACVYSNTHAILTKTHTRYQIAMLFPRIKCIRIIECACILFEHSCICRNHDIALPKGFRNMHVFK